MSDLRATNFRGRTSGSVPDFPDGVTVVSGISTLDSQGVRVAGIVTATSFSGDGSSLTSIASIVTGNTSVQTVMDMLKLIQKDQKGCVLHQVDKHLLIQPIMVVMQNLH